jgi:hypothetical protein
LLYIAACNLFEFEVSGNIGRDEDICQFAGRHEKFWYEIDIPVVNTAIFLPWFLPLIVVSVLLEELADVRQVRRGVWIINLQSRC